MGASRSEAFSQYCDGVFKIVSIVAIIVGGGWAYYEYEDAKKMCERALQLSSGKEVESLVAENFRVTLFKTNNK